MQKLLLILKLPPPVHGSTVMNSVVANSRVLNNAFNITTLGLSISKDTTDIGKWSFRKFNQVIEDYVRLFKSLRDNKPDLVYFALSPISTAFIKDSISIGIIKAFRVPIVYHLHVKGIREQYKKQLLKQLYRFVFKNEFVITLSNSLVEDIKFLPVRKIYIVPNGVSQSIADEQVNLEKSGQGQLVYLSNFIRSKGIVEFLRACGDINRQGLNFKIAIIGKPIDVSIPDIEAIISEEMLTDKIVFLGPAYGDEKFKILLNSNIFVFPTYYEKECLPLVLLEAMQCGLPIVTSKEGAISDIIKNGENGLLINPRESSEIADAIVTILESPEKSNLMSKKNRSEFLSHYTVQEFEKNLKNVLIEIFDSLKG